MATHWQNVSDPAVKAQLLNAASDSLTEDLKNGIHFPFCVDGKQAKLVSEWTPKTTVIFEQKEHKLCPLTCYQEQWMRRNVSGKLITPRVEDADWYPGHICLDEHRDTVAENYQFASGSVSIPGRLGKICRAYLAGKNIHTADFCNDPERCSVAATVVTAKSPWREAQFYHSALVNAAARKFRLIRYDHPACDLKLPSVHVTGAKIRYRDNYLWFFEGDHEAVMELDCPISRMHYAIGSNGRQTNTLELVHVDQLGFAVAASYVLVPRKLARPVVRHRTIGTNDVAVFNLLDFKDDVKYTIVPANVYDKLTKYALAMQDGAFDVNKLTSYLRATAGTLILGDKITMKGWESRSRGFMQVIVNSYIQAAALRYSRSYGVTELFKILKSEQQGQFWQKLCCCLCVPTIDAIEVVPDEESLSALVPTELKTRYWDGCRRLCDPKANHLAYRRPIDWLTCCVDQVTCSSVDLDMEGDVFEKKIGGRMPGVELSTALKRARALKNRLLLAKKKQSQKQRDYYKAHKDRFNPSVPTVSPTHSGISMKTLPRSKRARSASPKSHGTTPLKTPQRHRSVSPCSLSRHTPVVTPKKAKEPVGQTPASSLSNPRLSTPSWRAKPIDPKELQAAIELYKMSQDWKHNSNTSSLADLSRRDRSPSPKPARHRWLRVTEPYRLLNPQADGNCLYRCVALAIDGVQETWGHWKRLALANLEVHGAAAYLGEDPGAYKAKHSRAGEWADTGIVKVISDCLKRPFCIHIDRVYTGDLNDRAITEVYVVNSVHNRPAIHVLLKGGHFQVVVDWTTDRELLQQELHEVTDQGRFYYRQKVEPGEGPSLTPQKRSGKSSPKAKSDTLTPKATSAKAKSNISAPASSASTSSSQRVDKAAKAATAAIERPIDRLAARYHEYVGSLPAAAVLDLSCGYDTVLKALKGTTGKYAELDQKALVKLEKAMNRLGVAYYAIDGPPGTGKSYLGKKIAKGLNTLVVTPTSQLAGEWRSDGFTCKTFTASLLHPKQVELVVIDEASLFVIDQIAALAAVQTSAVFLLLGDPRQISSVDFTTERIYVRAKSRSLTEAFRHATVTLTHSYRCPRDVCDILEKRYGYPHLTTSNPRLRSISYEPACDKAKYICTTQATKAMIPGSNTVHEVQGRTYENVQVVLDIGDITLLANSPAHGAVLISRHTDTLYVRDPTGSGRSILGLHLIEPLRDNFELLSNQSLPEATEQVADTKLLMKQLPEVDVTPVAVCREGVVSILQEVQAADSMNNPLHSVTRPIEEKPKQGTYKVSDLPDHETTSVTSNKLMSNTREFDMRNTLSVACCLIDRYGKKTIRSKDLPADVKMLYAGLQRFMISKKHAMWAKGMLHIDPERLLKHHAAMIKSLSEKATAKEIMRELRDLGDIHDPDNTVKFFMKTFGKYTTDNAVIHEKCGQGISAWCKEWTYMIGPWIRTMEEQYLYAFADSVVYANGISDEEVAIELSARLEPGNVFLENDFTAFDSTQNDASLAHEMLRMLESKVPEPIAKAYYTLRAQWLLDAGRAGSLRGAFKKHSGEPGTLFFNTLYNMSVVGAITEGEVNLFAAKGDDSLLQGPDVRVKKDIVNICAKLGVITKLSQPKVPSFTNLLVWENRAVLDGLRLLGKYVSKNTVDQPYREQLAQAICDTVRALRPMAEDTYAATTLANSARYDLEQEKVEYLLSTLATIAKNPDAIHDPRLGWFWALGPADLDQEDEASVYAGPAAYYEEASDYQN